MATKMKIETAELRKSATVIDEKIQRYNEQWNKIFTEIENLKIEWQGESSDQFKLKLEEYRNDFQELAKTLTSYSTFLTNVATKTETLEENLKGSAQRLFTGR